MAESIKISLDTSKYAIPTQEDINAAKRFVLMREEYAQLLQSRIDEVLADAMERIITICYRYDVDPKLLYLSNGFNEQMMNEISEAMDEAEEEILSLIEEYSTRVTTDKDSAKTLLAWMLLLGRNNRNLQQTLDTYLYKFMKDIEAAVAALKYANIPLAQAITKAKTHLHTIYTIPEVQQAFKQAESFNATYIRSRGVVKGNVGLSNNGSTNVTNMAKTTLQMVWMRSQVMDYKEQGAAGLYVLRGSSYPCSPCDDNCGFHPIQEAYGVLPVHPSCCCYAIPIFTKEQIENLE
jgi:hypothetical protein